MPKDINDAYFIDQYRYNCPFCGLKSASYKIQGFIPFDKTKQKRSFIFIIECQHCGKISVHFSDTVTAYKGGDYNQQWFFQDLKAEKYIFSDDLFYHHIPSSFFILDTRIPRKIRETFTEAQECKNSNFKTGASACIRKVIYTFLEDQLNIINKTNNKTITELGYNHYSECIETLKKHFTFIDPIYFSNLSDITGITSDQVHEDSWEQMDNDTLEILLITVRDLLNEVYVKPKEREERAKEIYAKKKMIENTKELLKNYKKQNENK